MIPNEANLDLGMIGNCTSSGAVQVFHDHRLLRRGTFDLTDRAAFWHERAALIRAKRPRSA
jgi:hypothetical protein